MAEYTEELQSLLGAADVMLAQGELEQAFVLLERLAREHPNSPDVALLLGDAEYEAGNLDGALEEYDLAIEQDPDWAEAYAARANCLLEMGRIEEATHDVKRALALDSRVPQAHYVRAVLLDLAGDVQAADKSYRAAAKLAPEAYMVPVRVSRRTFDRAVRAAIKRLPERFRRMMKDVQVRVKDVPEPIDNPDASFSPLIMGAFDGAAITERRETDPWSLVPPVIYLYQRNIERVCRTREDLVEEIAITLMHEVGHYFGLGEEDLERLDLA